MGYKINKKLQKTIIGQLNFAIYAKHTVIFAIHPHLIQ